MKNFLRLFAFALSFTFVFTSCKKEEGDGLGRTTKAGLLTGKAWAVTAQTETDSTGKTVDIFKDYAFCEKDNYLKLEKNGVAYFYEGDSICADTPAITEATWGFTDNETKLDLATEDAYLPSDIVSLDENQMILKNTIDKITIQTTFTIKEVK